MLVFSTLRSIANDQSICLVFLVIICSKLGESREIREKNIHVIRLLVIIRVLLSHQFFNPGTQLAKYT